MVLVSIFCVNCRRQPSLLISSNACYACWSSGLSLDSPHLIWSRYRFSLETEHFVILVGVGCGRSRSRDSRVVESFVFVFRMPSSLSISIFVGNRASATPPLAGQVYVTSFWTLDGHAPNVSPLFHY